MARVNTRIGWSQSSAGGIALAVFGGLLAAGLYASAYMGAALIVLGFALLSALFAFVHPHRVLDTDEDDDPRVKVGDVLDD